MVTIKIVFKILLVLLIIITALQLIRRDEWWVRMSDFPHIQITIFTLSTLIIVGFITDFSKIGDIIVLFVGSITLIYQAIIIYPYTPLSAKQSKDWVEGTNGPTISILESNVYQFNDHYDQFLDVCDRYDADVVIALETDQKWQNGLKKLESKYKHLIHYPLDNTYGLLVYSKLEIAQSQINFLIEDDIPSVEADVKLTDGSIVRLYIVHPQPPSPTENERSTERDAELIVVGNKANDCEYPVLVAGDLNDVAWSHTTRLFQRLSGLLDPRIGRGFFNTFHAKYALMRWPLDHVFHSRHFMVKRIERAPAIGSDHFPMFIEFSLEPVKGIIKNGKPDDATENDVEEAEDKLERVDEK